MARRKKGLDIHGILLLDKRLGISSNKALQEVKALLNANKAGHTGSLDPMATGLLPLCFGEATKVSGLMLDDDKGYEVNIRLGIVTDTGDAEGQVVSNRPVPVLTMDDVLQVLKRFQGPLEQIPPMYSALKHQGKKLYELARSGIEIERKPRRIVIYELELLDFQGDTLSLRVLCSKGTYIRSLAEDIGAVIGCGASVIGLRRIQAGKFNISQAMTIEQLQCLAPTQRMACLLNPDQALIEMPEIIIDSEQAAMIQQGQQVWVEPFREGLVRLYCEQQFLGLGEMLSNGKLAPKRLFHLN